MLFLYPLLLNFVTVGIVHTIHLLQQQYKIWTVGIERSIHFSAIFRFLLLTVPIYMRVKIVKLGIFL